jgi:hypothetical protein
MRPTRDRWLPSGDQLVRKWAHKKLGFSTECVLTIFLCFIFLFHVSYIWQKYSDFVKSEFIKFFRFCGIINYGLLRTYL